MDSIAIIVPYFGKFNNYFSYWLQSAAGNADIDFLIFTDDRTQYEFPHNVIVRYIEFEELIVQFREKLGVPIAIHRPYKLCDLKPMYGTLFREELKSYDYWGYCDLDLIFGNIRKFITHDILCSYDKIFPRGHISIMRNDLESITMYENGGSYKKILQNPENCTFDEQFEGGINGIFTEKGKKIYREQYMIADVNIKHHAFYINSDVVHMKSVFYYKDGGLYRVMINAEGELAEKEYLYIHLQKRKMYVEEAINGANSFLIVPNHLIRGGIFIDADYIYANSKRKIYLDYYKLRWNNLLEKIKMKNDIGERR